MGDVSTQIDVATKAKRRVSTLPRRPPLSSSVNKAKAAGSRERKGGVSGGEAEGSGRMDHGTGSGR